MTAVLPKSSLESRRHKIPAIGVSPDVVESAAIDAAHVLAKLNTRAEGLTSEEARVRLEKYGRNVLAKDQRPGLTYASFRRRIFS